MPEDSDSFAHLVKNMQKRTDPQRYRAMRESFSLRPAPSLKELRKKLDDAKILLAEVECCFTPFAEWKDDTIQIKQDAQKHRRVWKGLYFKKDVKAFQEHVRHDDERTDCCGMGTC